MNMIKLAENHLLPDGMIRFGIRQLLRQRLEEEHATNAELQNQRYRKLLYQLRNSPIAIDTEAANEQHYELPAAFFSMVLGRHMKYSSCFWDKDTENLDQAEQNMLNLYLIRADLTDNQDILELGCGWGSLSLLMAERFPNSRITAVSNSGSQREYIVHQCRERGIKNLEVLTCDVNRLNLDKKFDRIVSVEMFEHMRNYEHLHDRIASWLKNDGKLFVHVFCHRYLAYPFQTEGDDNWLGRYFFTGGLMPARDTLLHFQKRLNLECQWDLSGQHYQKTSEAWLENMDINQIEIFKLFMSTYPEEQARVWLQRWRIFFMACAELFGYRQGSEWMVSHYRFTRRN